MTQQAWDEFDALTPLRDGRRGAHRPRGGRLGAVLPGVLVALVVTASGAGVVTALGGVLGGSPAQASTGGASAGALASAAGPAGPAGTAGAAAATSAPSSATAPASSAPASSAGSSTGSSAGAASGSGAVSASGAPSGTGGSASSGPSASAGSSASDGPSVAGVASTVPVVVLNGTRTAGVAARASTRLHADGWRVASTGNAQAHARTVVEYSSASLATTAAQLADRVGGRAERSSGVSAGSLTLVLGADYQD